MGGGGTEPAREPEAEKAVAVEAESVPLVEDMAPLWPDEAAESAFRAEARERGEPPAAVAVAAPPVEAPEENDAKPLPPLDDLVKRIPPEVREALDDLFRARFVTVRRVPAKALQR